MLSQTVPSSSEDIVQRQAAHFVHGNNLERNPGCVNRMVSDLGRWRKKERLTTLDQIQHVSVDMDTGDILQLKQRCRHQRSTETIPAQSQCQGLQILFLS